MAINYRFFNKKIRLKKAWSKWVVLSEKYMLPDSLCFIGVEPINNAEQCRQALLEIE